MPKQITDDEPISPHSIEKIETCDGDLPSTLYEKYPGLTIRQEFARTAMQAIVAATFANDKDAYTRQLQSWRTQYGEDFIVKDAIIKDSIKLADTLIAELNKQL